MMLYYETNPGQNYIASKMSETAVSKIQTNIREKITTQYTETVFEQLGTIGDGFVEAADGALQITDGTDQLLDGNGQLQDGIETLKGRNRCFRRWKHQSPDRNQCVYTGCWNTESRSRYVKWQEFRFEQGCHKRF